MTDRTDDSTKYTNISCNEFSKPNEISQIITDEEIPIMIPKQEVGSSIAIKNG